MPNSTTKSKTFLLIDDSEIDLKINKKILSLHFPSAHIASLPSAEEGLVYLKHHLHSLKALPDYILLDIQMPDMSGFEFLEVYQQFPKLFRDKCTLVMLSSTLDFGDIMRAEANLNVYKLLKKPLNPEEFKGIL